MTGRFITESGIVGIVAVIVFLVTGSAYCVETPVIDVSEQVLEQVDEQVLVSDIRPETGFSYIARLTGGRTGDQDEPRSDCILLENGKPLPTPRSLHADIRNKGKGRYSHWSKGALYFSTSDNTDPRNNGRKYVLSSKLRVKSHQTSVQAGEAKNIYNIVAPKGRQIFNRRLTIKNLDPGTTVIPRLALVGWPDLSSSEGILKNIIKAGMNGEEKTLAIWKFLVDWRYHYYPAENGHEVHDPVKFINVYGYGFCDDSAQNAAALASLAGLRSRIWGLDGHVVAETFYNNSWHMIDPDHEAYYRMPKGHIASVDELAGHPEIIQATKLDPIGSDTGSIADLYITTHNNAITHKKKDPPSHHLDPQLEPGDELIFDLGDQSAFHAVDFSKEGKPPLFANGRLIRQIEAQSAINTIHVKWPYIILGADLLLKNSAAGKGMKVSVSDDGKEFKKLSMEGDGEVTAFPLTNWFFSRKKACYEYWLRIETAKGISKKSGLQLTTKFQFAPRALAQVQAGDTQFELFIETPDKSPLPKNWQGLQIIHEWQESVD